MCRYLYGDGKCAHPNNIAIKCIGEDRCQYRDEDLDTCMMREKDTDESASDEKDYRCPDTKCGIYCQRYGRFYCAGENNCKTEEEYFDHLNTHGGRME